MKRVLNIIALLLTINAVVSAAGCAGKTQNAVNEIQSFSEQAASTVVTNNNTNDNTNSNITLIPVATPVATPASSLTTASSITTSSMKSMDSASLTSLDSSSTVVDVVCKMVIDKTKAEYTSDYEGTTYYFCCLSCKQVFDENPEKYIDSTNTEDDSTEDSEQTTTSETSATTNNTDSTSTIVVDVVCKMEIDKNTAEYTSEYNRKTYYFCSLPCKQAFDENPEKITNDSVTSLIAAFTADPTSGNKQLNVTFTDRSIGTPTSWNWNFGDGNTSIEQNPAHIYHKAGNYTVNLTVTNINNTSSALNTIIVFQSALPIANFSSNATKGYPPFTVQFVDQSVNSKEWKWDFGNGANSTAQNPLCIYNKAGKYNVTLTVKNANSSNKITKRSYITAESPKVIDVVCKMKIDKRTTKLTSVYKGKYYYFCSIYCKKEFDKSPEKYIS